LSLDLSATFDTIDHSILYDRASQDFGIRGTALSWLQSFVTDRMLYVAVGAVQSAPANCTTGISQGSVLGPLLFAMYISPVGNVVAAHDLYYRCIFGGTVYKYTYSHTISMPTTRSCTWLFDPELLSLSSPWRTVLMTLHAVPGEWTASQPG